MDPFGTTEEYIVADQPVTSPDQHKPGFNKSARIGAVISGVIILLMLAGNHHGNVENWWLAGVAGIVLLLLAGDWVMRKNGIRRG